MKVFDATRYLFVGYRLFCYLEKKSFFEGITSIYPFKKAFLPGPSASSMLNSCSSQDLHTLVSDYELDF